MALAPLFVSYSAFVNHATHHGHIVLPDVRAVFHPNDIEQLACRIETIRGWPIGTVVIVSFRRLEEAL